MFGINVLEAVLMLIWIAGLVSAVALFVQGRRGVGGILLVAAAVVVPVLGSLLAIGMFAFEKRPVQHAHVTS